MTRTQKLLRSFEDGDGAYISSKANIFYYSGFTSEDARLVVTKNERIILTDSRYSVQAKKQAPDFEIHDIRDLSVLEQLGIKRLLFEEEYLTVKELAGINKGSYKAIPAMGKISKPREVKEEAEIEKIRAAESLGDAAFSHILGFIKPGVGEIEIALELEMFMRKNGASGLSFETIAASGVRSAMPHGTASEKKLEHGDLFTLDFGCVLDGYCSDMTRTVAIGKPDSRQKEIYDTVLKAQKAACEFVAAGKSCAGADGVARSIIADSGYGENFGHSLGHSVGIEIHENPNLSPKSAGILEPGNVVTVEPGIYIEGFGGVRIEDLVVIGEKNTVNLTKSEKELIIL